MIEVEHLTKRYGRHAAVNDVSFQVGHQEVVGLLGPNGAGKSTIMRILACYMPATEGSARVAGYDVFEQADAARRRIGYMPENNPLHLDMRVREYLKFRARIKGLGIAESRTRVGEVSDRCGLSEVGGKIIGALSKGYRQRVGLADALVHEPSLIILDEPTIGLDPHQIRAVRQLIREFGRNHTVLISSHILPEVEMTCDRVLILHRGRILAADKTANLRRRMSGRGQVVAEIAAPREALLACWNEMDAVLHSDVAPIDTEYFRCALTPRGDADLRPVVFEVARDRGWRLRELTREQHTLEDVFVHLTGADRKEEET